MNPLVELDSLMDLFPRNPPWIARAEHVPASLTPEPYRTMLVHEHHMTVTMEAYHQAPVNVEVLDEHLQDDLYCRMILLANSRTGDVVQFGIVRFHLQYVTESVRAEIIARQTPLGRVLIQHNVLRHIDLNAILQIDCGPPLAERFRVPTGATTYGRLATIFCNRHPAVDLLEVTAPLESGPAPWSA